MAIEGTLYCGHVSGENARGNRAGKVCDGGDAAVFAQKVAELTAVAKNGKALDFFQGVGADKGGDAGGYIFRRADRNANACDATLVGHSVGSNEVSEAIL